MGGMKWKGKERVRVKRLKCRESKKWSYTLCGGHKERVNAKTKTEREKGKAL